jgi:hypothetical protein
LTRQSIAQSAALIVRWMRGSSPRMTSTVCVLLRVARKHEVMHQVRQNNPTGKSRKTLSSPRAKNIPLAPSGKSVI